MTPEQKKEYHNVSAKAWRLANMEQSKATTADWRADNRERVAATKAAWRKANPDKVREHARRSRIKNAATIRVRNQRYQETNRDKTRAWSRKHYKKSYAEDPEKWLNYGNRRRIRKCGGKLTRGLAKRLLVTQRGLCAICKTDLAVSGYHRDHIKPLSKGGKHEDANIQLLCPPCNLSKFTKSPQ